jgi:manganese/zinc/iron transport system permease protein
MGQSIAIHRSAGRGGAVVRALALLIVAPLCLALGAGPMIDWAVAWNPASHNTVVVTLGVTLLGAASGVIGSFTLLRKRALVGDVLSHAMLPGIALAFIFGTLVWGDGKSLTLLRTGGLVFGLIGLGAVVLIRNTTKLKEDAALGIVLSVFFGFGIAVLGVAQNIKGGSAAGLESFIYGKTASMTTPDARFIAVVGALSCWYGWVLFKEFALVCFDQSFAGATGAPVVALDLAMMSLVAFITIAGLQAVGLILMVAMLIIPPAAARFWTERLGAMMWIAAGVGAVSGAYGAYLSAGLPDLPAGAVIVLVAAGLFLFSMLFGSARGVALRLFRHVQLTRRIERQHLLRAMFEVYEHAGVEDHHDANARATFEHLRAARSWSEADLRKALKRAARDKHVVALSPTHWRLTKPGLIEAARLTRNHRLWEMYLITHADIATSHVDRDADAVEHVLGQEMVSELEALLTRSGGAVSVPPSPHPMGGRS